MAAVTSAVVVAAGTAYAANKSSKASKAQTDALKDSQGITQQATGQARGDAIDLFNRGLQSQNQGFDRSIGLLAGGLQPQADMMNQGNMNAQQTLLGGGQGFMNSILGQGGDPYASLQAQQITPNFSYLTDYVQQQRDIDAQANQPTVGPQQGQQPDMNITPFQNFLSNWNGAQNGASAFSPYQRIF